jgi:Ca2+-transporting ATPase
MIDKGVNMNQTQFNYSGLNDLQIKQNQDKYGLNVLQEKRKRLFVQILLNNIKDATIYLLIVASFLSFILKEYIDGAIIIFVLVFNMSINFYQEFKVEKSLENLKKLAPEYSNIIRNNQRVVLKNAEITIDDIVILEEGNIIPADLIILENYNLRVDESLLSGESFPLEKGINEIVYSSCKIVSGHGIGKVIKIGNECEVGKIAKMLNEDNNLITPLTLKLNQLTRILTFFVTLLCIFIFFISLFLKMEILEVIIFSLSLAIAAIPEGLPGVVSIVLSLGTRKLVKKNALVRKLSSVETLGCVDIVCSDKTGTITKNELEIKEIYSQCEKKYLYEAFDKCNNASLDNGDPLEVCLKKYLNQINYQGVAAFKIDEIAFSSARKMMSAIYQCGDKKIIYTKGAFEEVISRCKFMAYQNQIIPLNYNELAKITSIKEHFVSQALRTIAFGYQENQMDESNLIFLGLVGFFDPPRENIAQEIDKLNKSGIKTIMITGDDEHTAFQIGKEIGLVDSFSQVINGKQLSLKLDDQQDISSYLIFARVKPSQKVDIVSFYQKNNHVVLMTGDGVNDAPSIKKADVGVAMGKKGSQVCSSSSDIILLDDNFVTLVDSIYEGRNIYINIKKTILFLLSSNLGEIMSIIFFLIIKLPLPLLSIQLLWINLISDIFPAIALGNEKIYQDIYQTLPRKKDESIFASNGLFICLFYGFIIFLITTCAYLINPLKELSAMNMEWNFKNIKYLLSLEEILIKSRTYAFTTLSLSQLFHMIGMSNVKATLIDIFRNKNNFRIFAFIFGILLQVLVIEIPIFRTFFHTSLLSLLEWIWIILLSSLPLIFHQLLRNFYRSDL